MAHTILVVEDDAYIRELLGLELRAQGFEAVLARDAVAAISVARKEKPDLVLLDLGLPGGDGFLVMERFKALNAVMHTPIIVVTGEDELAVIDRVVAAGVTAVIKKPFEAGDVVAMIRRVLE